MGVDRGAVKRAALALVALTLGLPARVAAAADEAGPVIPVTATGPLREALAGPWLGGRLVLASVAITQDRVRVAFSRVAGGEVVAEVELRQATAQDGAAVAGGAFSVHAVRGDVAGLAEAVAERVRGLEASAMWVVPKSEAAPDHFPRAAPPAEEPDDSAEVALAIRKALQAMKTGDGEAARAALDGVAEAAKGNAGPDIAQTWYRIGEAARGQAVARAWISGVPDEHGVRALRARVLAGDAGEVAALAEAIGALPDDERCGGAAVAESLARTGKTKEAEALFRALGERTPGCAEVAALEVRWLLEAGRMAEADTRSQAAIARFPEDEAVIGLRAQVLLAQDRAEEAVALLEPVAWRNPDSGLVSSLQGAYMNVKTPGWIAKKRAELVARHAADPSDYTAAFLAGVIMHYEGRLQESNALLKPLVPILGKQPRLFIYLGMNAFDLGDADAGLAWIQKAFDLEAPDPDVYYCRAEILRYRDPAGALADLEKYLALTEGSPTVPAKKHARVAEMAATLRECVAKGGPVPCPGPWEHPRPAGVALGHAPPMSPWPWVAGGAAVLALLAGAAWALRSRRRRG